MRGRIREEGAATCEPLRGATGGGASAIPPSCCERECRCACAVSVRVRVRVSVRARLRPNPITAPEIPRSLGALKSNLNPTYVGQNYAHFLFRPSVVRICNRDPSELHPGPQSP